MGGELPQECIMENSPYETLEVTLWREREKICKEDHHTKERKREHRVYFLVLA